MLIYSPLLVPAAASGGGSAVFDANSPIIGLNNIVTVAKVATNFAAPFWPARNLASDSTYLRWEGIEDYGPTMITVSNIGASPTDYIGIARHNWGSLGINVTIYEATELDSMGDPAWTVVVPTHVLGTDGPVMYRLPLASRGFLQIVLASPDGTPPLAAVLYVGKLLQLPRHIYVPHTPITMGRVWQFLNTVSQSGHFLGKHLTGETRSTNVAMKYFEPDWVRTYLDPFIEEAATRPFFFSWRPGDYPRETGFVWFSNTPRPANMLPNGMMEFSMNLEGIA